MTSETTRAHGIHPARLKRLQEGIARVREILGDDADVILRRDTLEGETDYMETVDRLLEECVAAKHIADLAKARAKRFEARMERPREALLYLLELADLKKLERPAATVSLALSRPALNISEPDEIPMNFLKIEPDEAKIRKALTAGEAVPGASLGNARPMLRITPGSVEAASDE